MPGKGSAKEKRVVEDAVWITWENQVRNRSMSRMLGVNLYAFPNGGGRLKKYLVCSLRTLLALLKERPKTVFAQNPSLVLNLLLISVRCFFRYQLVSDAHFAGVIACNGSPLVQKVLDFCNRRADLVIVTTEEHASYVRGIGGTSVISEDPLPDIEEYRREPDPAKSVLLICSFDVDEPYQQVFAAARLLAAEDFSFFVTGNYRKAHVDPDHYPQVTFLGFLSEPEYYSRLYRSSVIVDLTDNENCLVCGAYEAMAAGRPLVTSATESLQGYFSCGTVFTAHDAQSIADAVRRAYRDRARLKEEIRLWRNFVFRHQDNRRMEICRTLGLRSETGCSPR